jgi:protein-S-isoprenylcysteine O-methyltransferase Ste14
VARRVRVPLGFVFAAFYFWRARPSWLSLLSGAVVAAMGLLIRALASGYVKKDRELTTTGPYALVRNPLYLGSIVLAIGFVVAARDFWITLALVGFFAAVYVPTIRHEEAFLRAHFPQYEHYARTVPRLLPRSCEFSGMMEGFSRSLYLRHHEYNAILGAAAMLAALVVKKLWFQG